MKLGASYNNITCETYWYSVEPAAGPVITILSYSITETNPVEMSDYSTPWNPT